MENVATKLVGAEKFGVTIKVDKSLDRKPGESSFPEKLEQAKKKPFRLKR